MNEDLKKRAEEIRDEIHRSRNTAYRVGSFLLDLLKYVSDPNGIPYSKSAKTDWKGNVIHDTYVTKTDAKEITPILISESEFEKLENPNPNRIYYVYEEE